MNEKCRVCLIEKKKSEFMKVINKIFEGKTILQIIVDCASIEILNSDPLPQWVCINCLEKLQSFYDLRLLILNSDKILKKNLSQIKEITLKCDILQGKDDENKTDMCEFMELENRCLEEDLKNTKEKNREVKEKFNESTGNENDYQDDLLTSPRQASNNHEIYLNRVEGKDKKPLKKLKRLYECQECNKTFKKADHYTLHMTKHTGEKKYACEFCPKRFARSYVLVYHRRVHTGERPYTCDICSKSFSSPSNFYTHKKIHTGERNYKCELCDESFIQSDSLKIHIRRIHTGERPFLCEICSSAFRSNSSLLTHKLDMHGKKEACLICNKLYSTRVLKEHIRRHKEREQGIKRFVCDQCGKRFTCSSSRKKHLLIHSGEKPFSCEICEKSFNQRSALKTHMRVHSDFMPFPCKYCPKSFRYKHHLRSHNNTHHKDLLEETSTSQ